jgi:hypothetical protein
VTAKYIGCILDRAARCARAFRRRPL